MITHEQGYWRKALDAHPDLHFGSRALLVGVDSTVLHYRNHRGREAAEVVVLDPGGFARPGVAHYGPAT